MAVGVALLTCLCSSQRVAREVQRAAHASGAVDGGWVLGLQLLRSHVDGQARLAAIQQLEGSGLRRRLLRRVEAELQHVQVFVPVDPILVAEGAQRSDQRLDLTFGLAV